MSIISALRRLRLEDHEFKANWKYIARLCFQKRKEKKKAKI
jgi:hypothetical protein